MKRHILRLAMFLGILSFVLSAGAPRSSAGQGVIPNTGLQFGDFDDTANHQIMLENTSELIIHILGKGGTRLEAPATVKLQRMERPNSPTVASYSNSPIIASYYEVSAKNGHATIDHVGSGDYIVEVSAPGYETHQERLTVVGGFATTNAFFTLHTFDGSEDTIVWEQPGAPPVAGAARKDVDDAITALAEGKISQAGPHVKSALKHAPDSPDVHFLAGFYDEQNKDKAGAQQEYETAIKIFPNDFAAQLNLGCLLINEKKPTEAIPHLEKALAVGPNSWRGHWMLAEAYLQGKSDAQSAKYQAALALQLGKEKALDAEITLAMAEAIGGDLEAGKARLNKFIAEHPKDERVGRAKESLTALNGTKIVTVSVRGTTSADLADDVPPSEMPGLPANVDAAVPPVSPDAKCDLPQVMAGAAQRSKEFVDDLEHFTAKETVIHEDLSSKGGVLDRIQKSFDYLAALEYPRPDLIVLDEMRNGNFGTTGKEGTITDMGLPAIGLVFHPAYSKDFNFTCEGLGLWKGQLAWQIRFEQKSDRPARIRAWSINGVVYPVVLKGRAWVIADSYNLLHIDTDLINPIKEARLDYEHMAIDYQPVLFTTRKGSLWLPAEAQVYSKLHGHYYRQDHEFSKFVLFSVDTKEKIGSVPDHI
jgi:Flp pilus assembly protein TadD